MEFTFHHVTVHVNTPDGAALEAAVTARMRTHDGFALATINMDHLDKLTRDPEFRAAYAAHDFVVADGNPIVWLSRLAGREVRLLPGSELVLPLARWAAQHNISVALVGSTSETLAAAAKHLETNITGLKICAQIAPPMGFEPMGKSGDAVIDALAQTGAGLALLALGAPKQELFAARARKALPSLGLASIGAGLDFIAGSQRRAPAWVRLIAMEWLWRAALSPARLGVRYLRSLISLPGHALRALRLRP